MDSKVLRFLGWVAVSALSLVLIVIVVAAFGPLPKHVLDSTISVHALSPAELASAESNIRSALLQAVAGVLLVIGAITAWRQMLVGRKQHLLDRHIAVTEAFTKAVENLGSSEALDVRLGGIYSLDRVADDDPSERSRIAELLSVFVRERAVENERLTKDVLAAVSILARREWPIPINLTGSYLAGAQLQKAHLADAQLSATNLNEAALVGAVLRNADLAHADLRKADLRGADLRDASLQNARMSGAQANAATQWPIGFTPIDHGVLIS